ncbi:MAG: ferrochelatase [Pirellulaceae bacterium]
MTETADSKDPNALDSQPFDAILLVSFGGPEGQDDVMPFLENVLRGKPVPRERMLEVAEHYKHFGGVSPINEQNRDLIAALRPALDAAGIDLPIYWGNRNWHPMLNDTVEEMRDKGHQKVIAFFTSMFSCYSGCRQYRENIIDACAAAGSEAPAIQKIRKGFNHPKFIEAQSDLVSKALLDIPGEKRAAAKILFTAHSIPMSMADNSRYVEQLTEASRLVASELGHENWELVFQSRSGPPQQPWLEPDVCDRIEELAGEGTKDFVIVPIGFVSDHMEVLFDLDTEAKEICEKLGVGFSRAASVGVHPAFISMVVDLIQERITSREERPALGGYGPSHDVCPKDCCLYPRPQRPGTSHQPASTTTGAKP